VVEEEAVAALAVVALARHHPAQDRLVPQARLRQAAEALEAHQAVQA